MLCFSPNVLQPWVPREFLQTVQGVLAPAVACFCFHDSCSAVVLELIMLVA